MGPVLATWFIRQFFWILGRNFRQPISPFPLQKTLYWLLGPSALIKLAALIAKRNFCLKYPKNRTDE